MRKTTGKARDREIARDVESNKEKKQRERERDREIRDRERDSEHVRPLIIAVLPWQANK